MSTTDRELLELAAKAAGAEYEVDVDDYSIWLHSEIGGVTGEWNPLTDDGDALRLAVTLSIGVFRDGLGVYCNHSCTRQVRVLF